MNEVAGQNDGIRIPIETQSLRAVISDIVQQAYEAAYADPQACKDADQHYCDRTIARLNKQFMDE